MKQHSIQPRHSKNVFYPRSLALVVTTLAATAAGRAALPTLKESPFLPPASSNIAPAAANATHQLSGVMATGKSMMINLTDTTTKRSVWIQVGDTVDGITAVSYDGSTESAVVKIGGESKTLSLHTAQIQASPLLSMAGPVPAAPGATPQVAVAPLLTQADQEREARMLVSDLLEIGVQQRKAYEEAQKKAAAEKAEKK